MGAVTGGKGGLAGHKALIKNKMLVDSTSSAISGQLDNIGRNIKRVDQEIKADEDGKAEYENVLRRLKARKAELEKRIAENQAWIEGYEKDLGPFKDKYAMLVKDIEQLYSNAKEKHAKGIQMLVDEFNYHIAFKRWSDEFTAVPFKPA